MHPFYIPDKDSVFTLVQKMGQALMEGEQYNKASTPG